MSARSHWLLTGGECEPHASLTVSSTRLTTSTPATQTDLETTPGAHGRLGDVSQTFQTGMVKEWSRGLSDGPVRAGSVPRPGLLAGLLISPLPGWNTCSEAGFQLGHGSIEFKAVNHAGS